MRRTIDKKTLKHTVETLQNGGIIAMPTETVYGLAADANNESAITKIYQAKGRPANHPLIVHIGSIEQLASWAIDIPDYAWQLAKAFWPGPLTLILKKHASVLEEVTGGQDTVGLRVPNNEIALKILNEFGGGLAAPSANSFGHVSPTLAEHVKQDLGDKVDLIIDGGICSVGIESTIVDCTADKPRILRPGMISQKQIEEVAQLSLSDNLENTPRVSGALESHYAPHTKTFLTNNANELTDKSVVVLSRTKPQTKSWTIHNASIPTRWKNIAKEHSRHWIVMPEDVDAYAHSLYEQLHFADQLQCEAIVIETVPEGTEWFGVTDRINKASS